MRGRERERERGEGEIEEMEGWITTPSEWKSIRESKVSQTLLSKGK